ncbi:cupin domain-containing protein [Fibrella aquatilis]|uniref:Cupin domain-containing protein n=1 Tax=Fibrella aquatilis TaxID=2817059 RepID=A0A939G4A7_9BACT|nr:cupin domain-containing protein [Fibrella aquatilis]MBO0931834.1 cupin domain-containing protein [Fibrella aquatilis]
MEKGSLPICMNTTANQTSTVSLANLDGKKIIHKTFRTGDSMPPHQAPVDVFVLVLAGQMIITLDEQHDQFSAGNFVVFPAGHTHALTCLQDAELLIYR